MKAELGEYHRNKDPCQFNQAGQSLEENQPGGKIRKQQSQKKRKPADSLHILTASPGRPPCGSERVSNETSKHLESPDAGEPTDGLEGCQESENCGCRVHLAQLTTWRRKVQLQQQQVCCCFFLPHEDVENGKLGYRNLVDQPGDVRARRVRENIATGETSQAITPYHFFNYLTSLAFITR